MKKKKPFNSFLSLYLFQVIVIETYMGCQAVLDGEV